MGTYKDVRKELNMRVFSIYIMTGLVFALAGNAPNAWGSSAACENDKNQAKKLKDDAKKDKIKSDKEMKDAADQSAKDAQSAAANDTAKQTEKFAMGSDAAKAGKAGCDKVQGIGFPAAGRQFQYSDRFKQYDQQSQQYQSLAQSLSQTPGQEQEAQKLNQCAAELKRYASDGKKQTMADGGDLQKKATSGFGCSGKTDKNAKNNDDKKGGMGMPKFPEIPKKESSPEQPEQLAQDPFSPPEEDEDPQIGSANIAQSKIAPEPVQTSDTNPFDRFTAFDPVTNAPFADFGTTAGDLEETSDNPFDFSSNGSGGGAGANSGIAGGGGGGFGSGDTSGASQMGEKPSGKDDLRKEENLAYSGGGGGGGRSGAFANLDMEEDSGSSFDEFMEDLKGEEKGETSFKDAVAEAEGNLGFGLNQDGSSLFHLVKSQMTHRFATGEL